MSGSLIGALRVTLGIDTAAFEEGLGAAQKQLSAAGKAMGAVGERMASIGQSLSLGITAPLAAFGASAFKAASDANELQSAFDQTFGAMAKDMTSWAVTTGDAMGRSTQSLQEAANTFGLFFNQAAPTREAAADMSKTFAVLAQDLASFYNVSESDALQKLRSGLAGESEPLRDFSVFLTEASVKAKALEMGLGDLSGEISEQDKIMARYALILEGTKNAQGDVGRTSSGTANQIRAMQAAFLELQITIGTKLLPVFTPLITKIAGMLDAFSRLPDGVQTFAVAAAGVSAALGPLLMGIGGITSAVGAILPAFAPLSTVISGTFGAGGVFAGAFASLGAFGSMLSLVGAAVAPVLIPLAALAAAGALIWSNWEQVSPVLKGIWEDIKASIGPAMTELVAVAGQAWSEFVNSEFVSKLGELASVIGNIGVVILKSLGGAVPGIIKALGSLITGTFKVIVDAVKLVYHVLTGDWSAAWEDAKNLVKHAVEGIGGAIAYLAEAGVGAVKALYNGVKDWIGDRLAAIWDGAKKMIQGLGDKFKWLWDVVVGHSYIPDMVDAIGANMARLDALMVKPATKAADAVAQAFEGLKQDVAGILDQLFPLQAELRAVMTDIGKLDQAKAKGLLNDQTYDAARAQLEARQRELKGEINPIKILQGELEPVTSGLGDLSGLLGELPQVASQAEVALREYGQALGNNIMGGLRDVLSGRTSLGDMIRDLFGNFLYRITTDAMKNIESAIFGEGGLGGFLGDVLSSAIGGRAIGGPVLANQPYIVGEKRPELFVPSTAGRIVPNLNGVGRGSGGGGPIEVRVTKSNLFDVEVSRIADGRVASGIAGYDRNIGSRVKDNMSRRG